MQFSTRLALIVCAAVVSVVVAVAAAAYVSFDRLGVEQVRARVAFVMENLRSGLETNLAIGLRLEELAIAQDMIERQRVADPTIVSIDILGADGRTLFSTDRGVIGELAPPGWQAAIAQAARSGSGEGAGGPSGDAAGGRAENWAVEEGEQIVFGAPIDIGIGRPVGHVVLALSAAERVAFLDRLAGGFGLVALAVLAVALLVAATGAVMIGRRTQRPLTEVAEVLAGGVGSAGPLSIRAAAARRTAEAAVSDFDGAGGKIGAIDAAG